jgi:hypothetical protein
MLEKNHLCNDLFKIIREVVIQPVTGRKMGITLYSSHHKNVTSLGL